MSQVAPLELLAGEARILYKRDAATRLATPAFRNAPLAQAPSGGALFVAKGFPLFFQFAHPFDASSRLFFLIHSSMRF